MDYQKTIQSYLQTQGFAALRLRAVLFDMDGVLFNSMPAHAIAWVQTFREKGFTFNAEDCYMHEGQTGAATIDEVSMAQRGHLLSQKEKEQMYTTKLRYFNGQPPAERMAGAYEVLQKIKADGLICMVVTGSGTPALLQRIEGGFPGIFAPEHVISSFNVKRGKPFPDPYLKALEVGGLQPWEAIVVENAPLGIRSAVAARLFTVALNTGPLPDRALLNEKPSLLFPSMSAFCDEWENFHQSAATENE